MARDGKLTVDDGMRLWKTRDAYRVQTVLLALFYFPQLLLVPFIIDALMRGLWEQAGIRLLAIAALWGVRWVLCTGLPWVVGWGWRQLKALCLGRAV